MAHLLATHLVQNSERWIQKNKKNTLTETEYLKYIIILSFLPCGGWFSTSFFFAKHAETKRKEPEEEEEETCFSFILTSRAY